MVSGAVCNGYLMTMVMKYRFIQFLPNSGNIYNALFHKTVGYIILLFCVNGPSLYHDLKLAETIKRRINQNFL